MVVIKSSQYHVLLLCDALSLQMYASIIKYDRHHATLASLEDVLQPFSHYQGQQAALTCG